MSEPLPEAPPPPTVTSWAVCPWCGSVVVDMGLHRDWHQKTVNRARAVENATGALRDRVNPLPDRLAAVEDQLLRST